MSKTLIVNLFGGPGCGKSTMAAAIFVGLKRQHVNCELVTEFAKDKVWEESFPVLGDQIYVFGQQYHRQFILDKKVDVIITDSPTLLSLIYAKENMDHFVYRPFSDLVLDTFRMQWNFNILMERSFVYNDIGRMENVKEAEEIDGSIWFMLDFHRIPYHLCPLGEIRVREYVDEIVDLLGAKGLYTSDDKR